MRFDLLGPLEVHRNAVPVDISGTKAKALLAVLLLNANQPVSGAALQVALWGENPPPTCGSSLRNHASRLRRMLGGEEAERIGTVGSGYRIRVADHELDVIEFRGHLRRARQARSRGEWSEVSHWTSAAEALWRGAPLADIPADTLQPQIHRLATDRCEALQWHIDAELRLGRYQGLSARIAGLVEEYPIDEIFAVQLMKVLRHTGRRSEALNVFARLRRRFIDELGIEPGSAAREAQRECLDGEDEPDGSTASSAGTVSSVGSVGTAGVTAREPFLPRPAQLPQPGYGFVGRHEETRALIQLAQDREGARVAVVTGPAGVGKTSLVLHFAHQAAVDFPDGQLFVDLHGYDGDDAEPADRVLARFLTAWGIPGDRIPVDRAERESLFRSTVAGRRLLVVLDNAGDYDQVRPLIPGTPASFTVVSSRDELGELVARNGARLLRLPPLSVPESVEALMKIVGPARSEAASAVTELARLCGGLPLALRIIAARLAAEPETAVTGLAAELTAEETRLATLGLPGDDLTVVQALDYTYRRLDDARARMFRLLSIHPGQSLDVDAASALLGIRDAETADATAGGRPGTARVLLRDLASVHLVERGAPDRFRLHDLVRLYGRQKLAANPAEKAEATTRLLDHYLRLADAGRLLIDPSCSPCSRTRPPAGCSDTLSDTPRFNGAESASAWFGQEAETLLAVTRLAASTGDHDAAWRLATIQSTHLLRSHKLDLLVESQRIGERSAAAAGEPVAAGTLAGTVAIAYAMRRDPAAKDHFERAIGIFLAHGDLRKAVRARANLAALHYELREFEAADQALRQAATAAREVGEPAALAAILANLGLTRERLGDHDEARVLLCEAIAINERAGLDDRVAENRGQLAWVLLHAGEPEKAFAISESVLAAVRSADKPLIAGRMLEQMGMARAAQGRLDEANGLWREALAVFSAIGSPEADAVRARMSAERVE